MTGCKLRLPQLEAYQARIERPIIAPEAESLAWRLEYKDYVAKVYPVTTTYGTQFISYAKDSLHFDGFIIRKIDRLGADISRWTYSDTTETPTVVTRTLAKVLSENDSYRCTKRAAQNQYVLQVCKSVDSSSDYIFALEFDSNGELWKIYQTLDSTGEQLILTKLK